MRTADFFSPESFADHLERRSSPRRWAILSILSLACLGTSWATEWQANREETMARDVARIDPDALRAQKELALIQTEINRYAENLDPLTEHLSLPTTGYLLQCLETAAGEGADLEKVNWGHKAALYGEPNDLLILNISITVRGDKALLDLPEKMREVTGMQTAAVRRTEVVPENPDAMRAEVRLTSNLNIPTTWQSRGLR